MKLENPKNAAGGAREIVDAIFNAADEFAEGADFPFSCYDGDHPCPSDDATRQFSWTY